MAGMRYLQVLTKLSASLMEGRVLLRRYNALKMEAIKEGASFRPGAKGGTGYPIVDAAMRCLERNGLDGTIGLRMIVAMFLTKDLMINWQWGERYFMRQLVDGDMAANNGGWQWSGLRRAPMPRRISAFSIP